MKVWEGVLSQTQREWLAFLELRAFFTGEPSRGDIKTRFGIKPTAVSCDLGIYRQVGPGSVNYDAAWRRYRPTASFVQLLEFHCERVLVWFLQGCGYRLELGLMLATLCGKRGQLVRPYMSVLAVITSAMRSKGTLKINYLSMSSRQKKPEIVPVNSLRWHVSVFDRAAAFRRLRSEQIVKVQPIWRDIQLFKQE